MYKIKFKLRNYNDVSKGFINFEWSNLEIVKENLNAIKEHYEFFKKVCEIRSNEKNKFIQDCIKDNKSFWLVKCLIPTHKGQKIDENQIEKFGKENVIWEYRESETIHYLNLKKDNGELFEFCPDWTDYRTSLIWIKISQKILKFKF